MTAATLPGSPVAAVPQLAPGRAVSRLAVRQLRRGAVVVALVCGVMSASCCQPIPDDPRLAG